MDIGEFAKMAGVEIVDCGEGWGGRIGYREKDSDCTICGFRTESAAYKNWAKNTFGDDGYRAITKLIKMANNNGAH